MALEPLKRLFGDSAKPFTFFSMRPFAEKEKGKVGSYRLGRWPEEKGRLRAATYANPEGFIEVTRENADTKVSEHFRLRDFITHDQQNVWPKYLVLREPLLDKLELIIDELNARGVPATRLRVMSGFRSPQYNERGVGRRGGRARDSRHQYGDAADVFLDEDGDGKMSTRDLLKLAAAAEAVERKYPELVGGIGKYRATRTRSAWVHVDVRGQRARW
ncbi:MAG: DUF882 domain-containing protein [Gemmatimonadaceae bacterium]|nr:DUF882 domain-containing protein [Gemmatimonadaceae bacterium]